MDVLHLWLNVKIFNRIFSFSFKHPCQGNSLIMIQFTFEIICRIDWFNALLVKINKLCELIFLNSIDFDDFLFYFRPITLWLDSQLLFRWSLLSLLFYGLRYAISSFHHICNIYLCNFEKRIIFLSLCIRLLLF